nr:ATP-binding protein [Alphaproteobacteria bacterium]
MADIIPIAAQSNGSTRLPMILTGQALMSLRDSGFDLPTALAEVVDNSIEARASKIQIRLDKSESQGKKHVHRIIIGDDGAGMDTDLLHHYLQIGYSTRYMSKNTIGKYGVGAKLAALNFGKRIDVWSRDNPQGAWQHVFFDLAKAMAEEGATGVFTGIEAPTLESVPADIAELAPSGSGTVVVWSDVDRLEDGRVAADFDSLLVDLKKELSRIFREFLDGGIGIEVNGTKLLPHDPLFLMHGTWAEKILLKEPRAKDGHPSKDAPVTEAMVIADEEVKVKGSVARLRVTLYPECITRKRGLGGDKLAEKLRVPDNEGQISFMRMRREIAYTNVPRILPSGVQNPDRFIGIEVSFDPTLDDFFGVRNVKRGVEPHGELRDKIRELLPKYMPQARKTIDERRG